MADQPSRNTSSATLGQSDAQAIIDAVERLDIAEHAGVKDPNGTDAPSVPFIVLPTGRRVQSLKPIIDEYRTKPERRAGTALLTTLDSFLEHVNRFKSTNSVVFCDKSPTKPRLCVVYDYHPAGGCHTDAAFQEHRAVYPFPVSEEWETWRKFDGKEMTQLEFARFIEARLPDVFSVDDDTMTDEMREFADLFGGKYASRSRLLDVSRSLEVNASVGVKQMVRLESGEMSVSFDETHAGAAGQRLDVPNLFVLAIPVFDDGVADYRIICRLRYRRDGGSGVIKWSYAMVDPKRYFEDAIKDAATLVEKETVLPVYYGKREQVVTGTAEPE